MFLILAFFFFYKIGEQEGRTCSDFIEGVVGNSGSGGGGEEMGRRMNMVQTYIQV
jgi:hypothetical protein